MATLDALGRLLRSPEHRRETLAYARYVGRHRLLTAAAKGVWDVARDRGRTAPPRDLELAPPTGGALDPVALPLARRPAPADRLTAEIPTDDPEGALGRHRFGWVPPLLAKGPADDELRAAVRAAVAWAQAHPLRDRGAGWDSYSVAERAVNWIYLASAAGRWQVRCDHGLLEGSLREHVRYLAEHLELRGEATNNHLINDGRALYLGGAFLGDAGRMALGRELLRYGAAAMFTESGFLREGSSHYHLLLCRTYLEVLACAAAVGDHRFRDELAPRVSGMSEAAAFLCETGTLPLIGDVSPDAPPAFLMGVPAVAAASVGVNRRCRPPASAGWHRLFESREHAHAGERTAVETESYPDAGYHRLRAGELVLTSYANPLGHVPSWSHGHADLGGFVLDWGDEPLLVDCGRASYSSEPLGRYGRSVRSHNAVSIDGYEPMVAHAHNGFLPPMLPSYAGGPPTVELDRDDRSATLRVAQHGFERVQAGLGVSRALAVSADGLLIRDRISGTGTHLVETLFHFAPGVAVRAVGPDAVEARRGLRTFVLRRTRGSGGRLETLRGVKGDGRVLGWFSPRYGEAVPTVTLRLARTVELPVSDDFAIAEAG